MTTLSFKPRVPPGQGHERMGQEVKITPQVKLSFSPGRPPTLDPAPNPAPAPAKPRGHRSSWPGQMWSHLTSMFTMQPVVNWVNPQLVTECPPPPLALYTGPPSHQYMPPPAVTPGGGLWHPAPPGNQQQQQMMDPLLMLQGGGSGGGYLGAKMGMNCAYPNAKMGTSDCFPGTKLGSNGYYPSPAYPSAKTDTNNTYPGTKMTTNGYYPSTKMEADCVYPNAEMGINGYVLVAKAVPESYLGPTTTTTTTTSSKPLNPYAEEWVPPGYYSNTPATPVVLKAPHHLQESTPVIPYSPQDFQNAVIEDALSAGTSTSTKAMDSQNMTQMDPVSATSPQESPGHSMGSESPLGYQEESHKEIEAKEGPSLGPEVQEIAEEGEREGESASPQSTASPGQENVCFGVPAYPDCIKIGEPDLAKCGPSSDTSSQSPEEVQVCFKVPASSECIKITKQDLTKSSPGHNMRSEERVRVCVAVPSEQTLNAKGVPDSAKEVLGSSMSAQSAGKVPCSATQNQRVLDSETPSSSAEQVSDSATGSPITAMSYARVVERATPSPPLPTKDEKCKRDRTPPRGVPAPGVGTCKILELFRRPSKDQRTRSRQFLQELKESSGGGGDWCSSFSSSSSSSPSSVSSSSSSFSDLSQIYNSSHIPSSSSQPLPPSSSSSFPSSSPVPISPLHPPRPPKSTPPMTPTSPGRERSESESSAASLDIDFADDVDCAAVTPVSAVPCAAAKKPINRFLACILGSGESDSEEEEEEEDEDDWDEVCVTDSAGGSANGVLDLDDSWETFGLEMIVLQCRKDRAKEECRGEVPENECQAAKTDDQTDGSNLSEINARWEREVSEGVPARSATRVRFGGTTVHPMVVWGHAYRKARSGPWEQQARDRARFRQRIGTVETELAPILEASHRTAVYERLYGTTTTTTTPTTGS